MKKHLMIIANLTVRRLVNLSKIASIERNLTPRPSKTPSPSPANPSSILKLQLSTMTSS